MKNTLKLALLLIGLVSTNISAQYQPYGTSYLALGGGFGKLRGTEALTNPTPATNNTGEYIVKGKTGAMTASISQLSGSRKFKYGYFLGMTLGATSSDISYLRASSSSTSKVPGTTNDFNVYGDLRAGLQIGYNLQDIETFFGFRYYNCWQADGYRTYYGNKDDAAMIGLFGAYKDLGLDLAYGSDKIPGFLVSSQVWDFIQAELRLRLAPLDGGLYLVFRYEHSILQDNDLFESGIIGTQDARANTLLIGVGFGSDYRKRNTTDKK